MKHAVRVPSILLAPIAMLALLAGPAYAQQKPDIVMIMSDRFPAFGAAAGESNATPARAAAAPAASSSNVVFVADWRMVPPDVLAGSSDDKPAGVSDPAAGVSSIRQQVEAAATALAAQTAPSVANRTPRPNTPGSDRFGWKNAIKEAMLFDIIQNTARLTNEQTRSQLAGPFVSDWFKSAAGLFDPNWADGNKWVTNYIAHPMGGAVNGHIAHRNSKHRNLMPGDKGYFKGVMQAMAFAAVTELNYEIGPISEASIGNVGMNNPDQQGLVDIVITPTVGAAWMVMEDYVYKHVLARIHGEKTRAFWHCWLNPSRTMANMVAFRKPWARR
jgi:hypothetical protein